MRKYSLDVCRIAACMAVVMIHTLMLFWEFDPASSVWAIYNFAAVVVRCGVPLFFMISGALLLRQEELDIVKHIKRILRFLLLYFVWSAICAFVDARFLKVWYHELSFTGLVFGSYYHLWYLPAMILCYAFVPLLHGLIHKNCGMGRYAVVVFMLVPIPLMNLLLLPDKPEWLFLLLEHFDLSYLKYLGYMLLGWWLEENAAHGRKLWLLGLAALAAVLLYSWLNLRYSRGLGEPSTLYYDYCSVAMVLLSAFVFSLCSCIRQVSGKLAGVIATLSGSTLGVYLVHPLFISLLSSMHIDFRQFNTLLFLPLCYLSFLFLSLAFSLVLGKIPILKKLVS